MLVKCEDCGTTFDDKDGWTECDACFAKKVDEDNHPPCPSCESLRAEIEERDTAFQTLADTDTAVIADLRAELDALKAKVRDALGLLEDSVGMEDVQDVLGEALGLITEARDE